MHPLIPPIFSSHGLHKRKTVVFWDEDGGVVGICYNMPVKDTILIGKELKPKHAISDLSRHGRDYFLENDARAKSDKAVFCSCPMHKSKLKFFKNSGDLICQSAEFREPLRYRDTFDFKLEWLLHVVIKF